MPDKLPLNSEAFQKGYESFSKNLSFNDNPYESDSQEYKDWMAGFGSAYSDFFYPL